MSEISELLKSRRMEKKMSQTMLARHLGWDGAQYVSNIERDLCRLPMSRFKKITKVLEISPSTLYNAYVKDVSDDFWELFD